MLAKAWAIAKNNPKAIQMEEFYKNLKITLQKGTTDKWAEAIVKGFNDHGGMYLRVLANVD